MKVKAREEELQIAETKMVMHQVRRRRRRSRRKGVWDEGKGYDGFGREVA